MKTTLVSATLLFSLLGPAFAAIPSTRRPSQATLEATFQLPVTVAGVPSGWATAPKGTIVNVEHMRRQAIMIRLSDTAAWVKRSDTDFDQRLAAFRIVKEAARQKVAASIAAGDADFKQRQEADAADFQQQHAAYENPLDKGSYDHQRSVSDFYDRFGRRYHIGVFGQRVYD